MIKYGLISKTDAATLEKTIDLICNEYNQGEVIRSTCIGIFDGDTDRGMHEYILKKGYKHIHTAIDNAKYFEIKNPFPECNLIIGNSVEVAYLIPDDSQDLIFVDGCHAFHAVISDYFCYKDKVKPYGYLAFHDTGAHIKPFSGYQDIGSKDDPDMYISVRKALDSTGLLPKFYFLNLYGGIFQKKELLPLNKWQLVFDEVDINDEAGGVAIFKKLY